MEIEVVRRFTGVVAQLVDLWRVCERHVEAGKLEIQGWQIDAMIEKIVALNDEAQEILVAKRYPLSEIQKAKIDQLKKYVPSEVIGACGYCMRRRPMIPDERSSTGGYCSKLCQKRGQVVQRRKAEESEDWHPTERCTLPGCNARLTYSQVRSGVRLHSRACVIEDQRQRKMTRELTVQRYRASA